MSHTLSAIAQSLRRDGFAAATRHLVKEAYHRGKYLLLTRQMAACDSGLCTQEGLRLAVSSDFDNIIASWPAEFGGTKSEGAIRRKIVSRHEKGYPCVLSERDGQLQGAVWCIPWQPDFVWQDPNKRDGAFEICNLFVAPRFRGQGVARQLLTGAVSLMARRGKTMAYSRILPTRQSSIAVHLSVGFRVLGLLNCVTVLGQERDRFVPLTKAGRSDLKGLVLPPCVLLTRSAWGGTLEAIRRLGSRGVPVYVFVLDKDSTPYEKSRYCAGTYRLNSADASSLSQALSAWCKTRDFPQKPLLIPMIDIWATYVADNRSSLENDFTIGAAHPDTVLSLLEKGKATPLAASCGLDVPQSSTVRTQADLQATAAVMQYPVIAKPVWWREKGQAHFKTMLFQTPQSVVDGLAPMLDGLTSVLIQEYVRGTDQDIETFMFYRDRRGRVWGCTGRKLRQCPPNAGIMACGHAIDLPQLRHSCTMFLDRIDYRGLGGVEFKRLGSKLYYIETSVRPEGFHALSRKAGLDLVWIAYCDYCLGGLSEEPYGQHEAFYLDWSAFKTSYGRKRIISWMLELVRMLAKRPLKIAVFEWADPAPSLYLLGRRMWERCHRLTKTLQAGGVRQ